MGWRRDCPSRRDIFGLGEFRWIPYNNVKAALTGLTRGLAIEIALKILAEKPQLRLGLTPYEVQVSLLKGLIKSQIFHSDDWVPPKIWLIGPLSGGN